MTKNPRNLRPGPRSYKKRGAVHRITTETKPGRAPAPIVSRWSCSCGAGSDWISEPHHANRVNAEADAHVQEHAS